MVTKRRLFWTYVLGMVIGAEIGYDIATLIWHVWRW